ncbi:hypothetical protein [Burkholderia sp. F1]
MEPLELRLEDLHADEAMDVCAR